MIAIVKYSLACAMAFWMVWGDNARTFAGDAPTGDAAHLVTELHDSLIAIMKNGDTLGYQGRYQAIAPVIDKTHDIDTIARLVVGRHWKELTETQQSAFVQTFRNLSIATYAGRFKAYGGERFAILSEKPLSRGNRTLVASHLVKTDGERITFHYIVRQIQHQWKILNISVNGVSDLALKRAEYGAVLKKDGLPILMQRLQAQIQDHARTL